MLGSIALQASAQSIDPKVLQQVQGQLGVGSTSNSAATQVDRARESSSGNVSTFPQTTRIDTTEEQQLRREQARAALAKIYRPSPIEREFRSRLADTTLRQFGYELFQSVQDAAGTMTGSAGDSYIIGFGDELVVQFQGATNDSKTVRVDREGRLIVAALPPIPAAGRSLGAVRNDLEAATRRTMLGTEVFVSLGSVRAITVFVGGEVERPGQVGLTALADISAALARAGGIRRSGSLRNVKIISGGSTRSVDLYGLLGIGAPPAVRLRDGDRIIVPVIGDTAAVAGSVSRPGIYELRGNTSVSELLAYAGGALRPRGNSIAISRISADGAEEFVRAATLSSRVVPGDALQLVGGSAGGATGRVTLYGNVQNPGPRPLSAAPTVRDLLGEVRDLRFDTYMPMAILIRRDPVTATRSFQPVNLMTALQGRPGVALRSDDRLYVFARSDIDFINRSPVRRIVLGQPNPLPDCVSLNQLEALVRDTQSARFNVVTRGSFIVERGGQSDVANTGGTAAQAGSRRGDESLRTGADPAGLTVQQQDMRDAATEDEAAAQRNLRCPMIFENEPGLLPILIENAIGVGGAVRQPGAYPIADAVTVRDIANVAEGLLTNASSLSLDIIRAQASATGEQHMEIDTAGTQLMTTMLRPGDDIRFNAALPQFEAGGVLLTGEFGRPGLYSIRRGETLSQLIARAGGVTSLAYPYGAIFTRRSVKELQQEGFRRTGREMANALLAVSARKESSGDSIAAASNLIATLSTIEAPGRVVIEADPRVLAIRPDLDTVMNSGDAIYMPTRPNFVLALGDVSNPGALQFIAGKGVKDYISETGGTAATADSGRTFLVLPNGTAQPVRNSGRGIVVPPGSTIIVPKDIDPLFKLDVASNVAGILGNLITSVATIALLAK
ncbi:SLBB domain-containing protein [Polymorphobacter arshaanensis]|nr:SLBB domain-containing protein [Polymorphobacter arshaanensis]